MNNEPVAWINLDRFKDEALYLADCVSENKVENMGITTPLYTHPAKTLTPLTEDECRAIIEKQAAEIEALKLQLHTTLTNRDLRTYDGKAQEK
jgi:hypothetical protein